MPEAPADHSAGSVVVVVDTHLASVDLVDSHPVSAGLGSHYRFERIVVGRYEGHLCLVPDLGIHHLYPGLDIHHLARHGNRLMYDLQGLASPVHCLAVCLPAVGGVAEELC